jgi:hypothetical protein
MAWAFGSTVAAAGIWLSCAGSLADPPLLSDDSNADPAAADGQPKAAEAAKHDASGAAVIATLRTRDSELTILSEGGSMRYALLDAAGTTKNLTLDQLRAYDPNLFEFVKTAMARRLAHPSGNGLIDARIEPAIRWAGRAGGAEAAPSGADRKVLGLTPAPGLAPRD